MGLFQALAGGLLYRLIGVLTLGVGFLLGFVTRWLVTALLLVVVDKLADSLKIRSFGTALLGGIIITFVTSVLEAIVR